MLYALTADQMRELEARVVDEGTATLADLMERAGAALARAAAERWGPGRVGVVCGSGNNGGDGWVAARRLAGVGRQCHVISVVPPEKLRAEAHHAARSAIAEGVSWEVLSPASSLAGACLVIDAVFGFGFHGPVREPFGDALRLIGEAGAPVLSADVPSGVDSDTGTATPGAVTADVTLTFTASKPGLLIFPGAHHAGEVVVADIGVAREQVAAVGGLEVPTAEDLRGVFPRPAAEDHKGSRGRVALVTGSTTYPGAAVLATEGASRLGPGFTVVVVPEPIADIVRIAAPHALVRPVPSSADGAIGSADAVVAAVADADAVVVGPGLTTGDAAAETVRRLIADVSVPLVLDADALNTLDGLPDAAGRTAPLLVTPHPGEAARMLGMPPRAVQDDRVAASAALCGPNTTCLLKGARTIVAGEGRRAVIVAGNAGLARAGSGDVLAGMLGTLLAQGLGPYDAAVLAAFLHGRAAEHGTRRLTVSCFRSTDIVRFLPDAVREVTGE